LGTSFSWSQKKYSFPNSLREVSDVTQIAAPEMNYPRVSVITPSYNQGHFIEETIRSVLEQGYPNLEFSVFDGGSTDRTVEVLKKYSAQLSFWRSERDGGQAAAINEGFRRSTGDILCWLNSDDLHFRHTLSVVAGLLGSCLGQPVVVYGGCEMFDDRTHKKEVRKAMPFSQKLLETVDFLDQPSVFWTRKAWEIVGPLDESLHYGFDWEWFLRAGRLCRCSATDSLLSRYRIHEAHKSGTGGQKRWIELLRIVRRHSPPTVVNHYEFLLRRNSARWWLNKRMRLFLALRGPLRAFAGTVATLLSPPFWFLPAGIERSTLWQISGIGRSLLWCVSSYRKAC
jgi:glycosyltransferase involved in cell wall biosynthesis